jgi:hypothetical protein
VLRVCNSAAPYSSQSSASVVVVPVPSGKFPVLVATDVLPVS